MTRTTTTFGAEFLSEPARRVLAAGGSIPELYMPPKPVYTPKLIDTDGDGFPDAIYQR